MQKRGRRVREAPTTTYITKEEKRKSESEDGKTVRKSRGVIKTNWEVEEKQSHGESEV